VTAIRPAVPADHSRLREIATASKGVWGYDDEQLRTWAAGLDLNRDIWVAEEDGGAVGWVALLPQDDGTCELDDLWVDAPAIGRGAGTALFRFASERARSRGATALRWEADPNAVGFYERMGATVVGEATSSWGRTIPVMRVEL
jgi:GNAT superfamily N-acetyltransferase